MAGLMLAHPGWVALGLALVILGAWMMRWANRQNIASILADATTDAALGALRHRRRPEMPEEIRARIDAVASAPTTAAKARRVAGYTLRHAASHLVGIAGFVGVVVGAIVAAIGAYSG